MKHVLLAVFRKLHNTFGDGIQRALQVNHPAKHNYRPPERDLAMNAVAARLIADESGFIISAELILIGTIAVLAMVVGLSEVALNINNELEDVASAFGAVNQSFRANGMGGHGGTSNGSSFGDQSDFCDGNSISSVSPNGGEQ